jgi:hypothetical protein
MPDLSQAYDEGVAAATRGEEAAPGCTTTPEGRAFLRGYVDGASARGAGDGGICGASAPPMVGGILTDVGMTLSEAAAAIERGDDPPLTDVQRRMVETWALEHAR